MSATNKTGQTSAATDLTRTTDTERSANEALNIMQQDQDYKPLPVVSETFATVIRAIHGFPAKLSIGWQQAGTGISCRYVCDVLSPRLFIDLVYQDNGKILISLSNGDVWQADHDLIMPRYAFDVAHQIRSATRNSKLVRFKQSALRSFKGG